MPGSAKRTVASPASSPVPDSSTATPSRITGCPSSGAIPSSVGTVSRTLGRSSTPGSRFVTGSASPPRVSTGMPGRVGSSRSISTTDTS